MTEQTDASVAGDEPTGASPLSTKDKIKKATRPTETVDICLQTGLQTEYEALHDQLRDAVNREAADKRLNSGGESRRLAQQIEAMQAEMAEYVITFRLHALGPKGWARLQGEHPPREGNTDDALMGYNPDTFFDAAVRACTVEPGDLDDADWLALFGDDEVDGKLTAGQRNELHQAVLKLNVRKISVPNSLAASRILRASAPE